MSKQTEALKLAQKAMGLIGADLVCEAAHHEKKDRHQIGEPCPIQARWHQAFAAIREALAEQPAQQQEQKLEFVSPGGGYVPAIPKPIPLDWKLVPRKATPEMLKAMDECAQEGYDERLYAGMASSVYMAAWDASPVMGTLPEQPAQQQDLSEQGRTRSAILGNNVEAMVDAGLSFTQALDATLKVYDHPAQTAKVSASDTSSERVEKQAENVHVQPAQQQEPFGHVTVRRLSQRFENHADQYWFFPAGQPPYLDNVDEIHAVYTTTPPRKPWVGLTDEEIDECFKESTGDYSFACLIERKLKEKNT